MEIFEKIIVPIITAVLGFLGGLKYEKHIINQKNLGDNNGNIAGGNIKNVYNKK